jgi:hypothetical protein
MNPQGDLVSIPGEHLDAALAGGYTRATQAQLDAYDQQQKYGTGLQTAKTAAESTAKGLVGPLAPLVETDILGIDPKEIAAREEANPGVATAGTIGGLTVGSIYGVGEAALLGKAGDLAAHGVAAMLPEATGLAGRLGTGIATGAARGVAENALFQAGDETSKMIEQPTADFTDTAMTNVGMAALLGGGIGGAFGTVSPLWKATFGKDAQAGLEAAHNDANGIPQTSGPDLPGPIKKIISVYGGVSEKDTTTYLKERDAMRALPSTDEIYQHGLQYVGTINDAVAKGKMDEVDALAAYKSADSDMRQDLKEQGYDVRNAAKTAADSLKQAQTDLAGTLRTNATETAPSITDAVGKLKQQALDGSEAAVDALHYSDKTISLENTYNKGQELIDKLRLRGTTEAKAQAQQLQTYLDGVHQDLGDINAVPAARAKPLIQGLQANGKYGLGASEFDKGLSGQYKQLAYTLDSDLKTAVPEYAAAMKPVAAKFSLLDDLKDYGDPDSAARRIKGLTDPLKYKEDMPMLRDLEAHTNTQFTNHIEPYANPDITARLKKAIPEYAEHQKAAAIEAEFKNPRTQAAMQEALANSPEHKALVSARAAKEAAILEKESLRGVTTGNLESKLKSLGMGKEGAKNAFAQFPQMNGQNLEDVLRLKRTQEAFSKGQMNGSRLVNAFAGLLGGIGGLFTGHTFAGMALGSQVGAFEDRYGPTSVQKLLDIYLNNPSNPIVKALGGGVSADAARVAMAKVVDSANPASAEGFKAAADLIHNATKGENLITKATKGIFKAGAEVLPSSQLPTDATRASIDKSLKRIQTNPNELLQKSNNAAYYMPQHGAALAQTATKASNYLNSIRPNTAPAQPLDSKRDPSPTEKAAFGRALDIAQQPLVVLKSLAEGRLVPDDMKHLQALYPALTAKLQSGLISQMTEHISKGESVPYSTRMGLSLFLGQPLDSTMTPTGITAAQMALVMPSKGAPATSPTNGKPPSASSVKGLEKMGTMYQTAGQKAQKDRDAGAKA